MLRRGGHLATLRGLLARNRVIAILGARQVGKTTLARELASSWRGPTAFFDLEDPRELARLAEPTLTLGSLRGLVVLDEIQRTPELFAPLRVLADRPRGARFLVLGSASLDLLRHASESLAGRIAVHHVGGLSLGEVGIASAPRLWRRGGFPRAYLARTESQSAQWRRDFVRTFVERDLPQLAVGVPGATLGRFWSMLAHYHGQLWSSAELARAFGVADTTVRRYLDLLVATFMVRMLQPWHENLGKRQVKAPKLYLSDTGVLHTLLGIETQDDLERHPKVGASWEGFAISALIDHLGARPEECFFWGTHGGAELDLLVIRGGRRRGFEIKRTDTPRMAPSLRIARDDLRLDSIDVIHAGEHTFALADGVRAVALERMALDVPALR